MSKDDIVKKTPLNHRYAAKTSKGPLIDAYHILMEVEKNCKAGNLKKALAQCQMLLKQHPNYVGALHIIGSIYDKLGDKRNAIHSFAYAEVLDPQNILIKLSLAQIYLEVDSVGMALLILKPLAELHRENLIVQELFGVALELNREYEKAVAVYDRATDLDPNNCQVWNRKALALTEIGLTEEASIAIHKSVEAGPANMSKVSFLSNLPRNLVTIDVSKLLTKETFNNKCYV